MLHIQSMSALELLLQTVVNQYFSMSYCLTIVAETHIDCTYPVSFTYMVYNNQSLTDQMLEVSEKGCSDYIVRVRDPEMFMDAFEEVNHLGNTRRSDRKIVFVPYVEDDSNNEKLLNIASLPQTSFLANLLMIVPVAKTTECESFDLVTHKYVGPDAESRQLVYLDRWNSCSEKFDGNVNLFPHDMSDLYGKSFKVACFTYKPYSLLDLDTALEPTGRDGVEIRAVNEFCRWLNCTVQIIRDDEEHEWGEIYENRTGVGVLGSVVEDHADAGIAALYSWYEEYVQLDFSVPTVRTAITCVAPAPRLLASWEMPLMPFTLYMWIGLLVTFIYSAIALTIANRCSTDRVVLTTFGMLITQSQPESAVGTNWGIRRVTAWLLISGLILDNAYGGGLASVFTVPKYEPSIDTVKDLIDRRMEWGATHDAWVFSLTLSSEPLQKQLVSLFRVKSADEMKEKSFTRQMAFSIEKLPAGNFAVGDYITKEALINLSVMLEDFYYEQCVIMLRKSSQYTEKMSQLLGRLHQSGLLLAWETQDFAHTLDRLLRSAREEKQRNHSKLFFISQLPHVALHHMNYEVQLEVRLSRMRKDVDVVEALNLRHVVGIFFLYAFGVLFSVALFFTELLWHRKHKTSI